MRIILFFLLLFLSTEVMSELLKPQPNILPEKVVNIQLQALKNNDHPYNNAGIEQTWEFAHPSNKEYTGPLSNFVKMMHSGTYSILLNHRENKIIFNEKRGNTSFFLVELVDKFGNRFGFQWIVKKVLSDNKLKDCWMTISVSQPVLIAKST